MKKVVSAVFVLLLAVAFVGACGKKKEEAPPATGGGDSGMEKIGVVECDVYIEKLTNCINAKVPDMAKGMLKTSFDQAVKGWKQAAATPEGKASLSTACKMATDSAKQMVAAYGCEM